MSTSGMSTLVVLTADGARFHQVLAAYDGLADCFGPLRVEWMVEPMQVAEARLRMGEARTVTAVLDLTVQQTPVRATAPARRQRERLRMDRLDDAGFAWPVAAMLAVFGVEDRIPLLLVSENRALDQLMSANSVVRRIDPHADDDVWNEAVSELLAVALRSTRDLKDVEDLSRFAHHAVSSTRLITLSSEVQVDLDRWIVLTRDGPAALTPQEIRVLDALLHALGHFFSADDLARRVSKPDGYPAGEHCVRQTICELRRKLGDTGTSPHLLVNRRGLGYALIIDAASHLGSHELTDVVAAHVASR